MHRPPCSSVVMIGCMWAQSSAIARMRTNLHKSPATPVREVRLLSLLFQPEALHETSRAIRMLCIKSCTHFRDIIAGCFHYQTGKRIYIVQWPIKCQRDVSAKGFNVCYVTNPLLLLLSERSQQTQCLKFRTSIRMAPSTDIDVCSNSVSCVCIPQGGKKQFVGICDIQSVPGGMCQTSGGCSLC